MHHLATALLLVAFHPAASDSGGSDANPESVALKHIESADVIYTLHRGPYWTLGRAFAEIDRFMADNRQRGAMFARFLENPTRADASRLRTEVGFVVTGNVQPGSQLLRKTQPAHLAACLVVKGPHAQTSSHYQRVYDWITANNYVAGDGITEFYPDRSADQAVTEIRIPVQGRSEAIASESSRAADVTTLCGIKAYTRVAEILIPGEDALPETHRKWLADVVDRLRVIREIVEIKQGQRAGDVSAMITPLVERAVWLRPYAMANDADDSVDTSVTATVVRRQKEAVLVALDRVMVRTHLNELAAVDIHGELVKVLASIQPIVEGRSVQAMRGKGPEPRRDTRSK